MKFSACLLSCLLVCPAAALASDPFNYNYVELGYQTLSQQNGGSEHGPDVDFSYTVYNTLQVVGGYARLDASAPVSSITYDNYFAGIRGESNFDDNTDFVTDILYINNRSSYQGIGNTDSGYRLALGLRHLFTTRLEFDGSLGRNWLDQTSNDVTAGLLFNATSWLAAGISYTHDNEANNITSLRLRVYF
ncbi:MAG: hypothetical protein ACRER7_08125 [Gammaproteobacteria bacterium]